MKFLLAITLMFAAVLTANAQAEEERSEAEVEVQKAMTELRQIPSDIKLLDESNKKLAISNQVQTETTKMLNRQEQKIKNEDAPSLMGKVNEFDEKVQKILSRGCGANFTPDRELAEYCNAANDEARKERTSIEATQTDLRNRMQMIIQTRTAVSETTLKNFEQQGKNDAALNNLQARKLTLYSQVITRRMRLAKSNAIASQACKSLPLEKASCCLQVVSDGRNPAQCDVELLFKLFENAGAFSTTEVRQAN